LNFQLAGLNEYLTEGPHWSDLEQMPHLLNFLESNGTLLANPYPPLISHTANDILTSMTGVYPDRQGVAVANAYGYYNLDGSRLH